MSYQLVKAQNKSNRSIALDTYQLEMEIPSLQPIQAGQFVDVAIPGKSLRRPLSVADVVDNKITLIYKVVGEGSKILSQWDQQLDVLLPCGKGFDFSKYQNEILIIGGGLGVAPMYYAAKQALQANLKVTCLLGFQNREMAYLIKEFEALPIQLEVVYDSDNENVVERMLKNDWQNLAYCTCGPLGMMKAIKRNNSAYGQVSLEARMGCGFGACMGCSIQTKKGPQRVCKEGPVFESEDMLWQD